MFERFTDQSRRALVLAQEEARLLNHNFIGTEHILLGLARDSEGVPAKVLVSLGARLEELRQRVQETNGPTDQEPLGSPPFTPRAKRALELGLREALQLGHNYIAPGHILLGLVREGEGAAAQVLVGLGVDLARVRQQAIFLLASQPAGPQAQSDRPLRSMEPWLETRRGGLWRRAVATFRPLARYEATVPKSIVSGDVGLVLSDNRLTGTVAGSTVDLALALPASEGKAEGTFAGADVLVVWRLAANGLWHPDVPGSLHGTFAGATARLLCWSHLGPGYFFDHASIEGDFSGQPVTAFVVADDGAEAKGSFVAHGVFANSDFSVRGSAEGTGAYLEGSVSGRPVQLRASTDGDAAGARQLTGTYAGPVPLLALFCGALLSFA
jgi:ATP-dependent Clp protease ATP-binding subunit ClpC